LINPVNADQSHARELEIEDGRVLVVEYKGEHLYADAEEKRAVGAVWEGRSNGKCLFVMPDGNDLENIRQKMTAPSC
jgi:type III restriction enzyme